MNLPLRAAKGRRSFQIRTRMATDCSFKVPWRIFSFPMHSHHPHVERLQLHLLNEQQMHLCISVVRRFQRTQRNHIGRLTFGWFGGFHVFTEEADVDF